MRKTPIVLKIYTDFYKKRSVPYSRCIKPYYHLFRITYFITNIFAIISGQSLKKTS